MLLLFVIIVGRRGIRQDIKFHMLASAELIDNISSAVILGISESEQMDWITGTVMGAITVI